MQKGRLEAFSDGVVAILITILVLEFRVPDGTEWSALRPLLPTFLIYVLSFAFLGTYWTNHHHMLQLTTRINGRILWANLQLLFWLSLVPFVTAWMGRGHFATAPTALYGLVLLLAGVSYALLQHAIIVEQGEGSPLAAAIQGDAKGKISLVLYATAILLAFVRPAMSDALYAAVALSWLIPDPRIESRLKA
jgi:uncharacterized membrane protein